MDTALSAERGETAREADRRGQQRVTPRNQEHPLSSHELSSSQSVFGALAELDQTAGTNTEAEVSMSHTGMTEHASRLAPNHNIWNVTPGHSMQETAASVSDGVAQPLLYNNAVRFESNGNDTGSHILHQHLPSAYHAFISEFSGRPTKRQCVDLLDDDLYLEGKVTQPLEHTTFHDTRVFAGILQSAPAEKTSTPPLSAASSTIILGRPSAFKLVSASLKYDDVLVLRSCQPSVSSTNASAAPMNHPIAQLAEAKFDFCPAFDHGRANPMMRPESISPISNRLVRSTPRRRNRESSVETPTSKRLNLPRDERFL